jgi:enoyl-CoA hydratase/carnithine racemase
VLRAEGRSFCVGFDVGGGHERPWRHDALKYRERLAVSMRCLMTPWTLKNPVIASVQGHALGGGCELAMFCDLTIAADDAVFGEPEILFSQVGPAVLMPFIVGHKRARELIYFGDKIDARRAHEIGMVNRVVPAAELSAATMKYAKRLSLIAPEALAAAKLALIAGSTWQAFGTHSMPVSTCWRRSMRRRPRWAGSSMPSAPRTASRRRWLGGSSNWRSDNCVPRTRCSAKRCTADAGSSFLIKEVSWVPVLQRTTSCCAAPGTRDLTPPYSAATPAVLVAALRAASRACFTGDSAGLRLNSFCALPPRMLRFACMSMNGRS